MRVNGGRSAHAPSAEAIANDMTDYIGGWLDAVAAVASDAERSEIADQLRAYVCDSTISDAELIMLTRAMTYFPNEATGEGFDCIMSRRETEDIVLWTVMDAYLATGLAPSGVFDDWRDRAVDPRTIRRLGAREGTRPRVHP